MKNHRDEWWFRDFAASDGLHSARFWEHACQAGWVPKYEEGWLSELRRDPFAKLRPLCSVDVARNFLEIAACRKPTDPEVPAQYVASCLRQSEQYFVAANAVDLTAEPLLLYYATVALAGAVVAMGGKAEFDKKRRPVFKGHGLQTKVAETNSRGQGANESEGHTQQRADSLADFIVRETRDGVYAALRATLPGEAPQRFAESNKKSGGAWRLTDLFAYVPELVDILSDTNCSKTCCGKNIVFVKAHPHGQFTGANFVIGPVLPERYLREVLQIKIDSEPGALHDALYKKLPDIKWSLGRMSAGPEHIVSAVTGEPVWAFVETAPSRYDQQRIYPLLFEGSLNGDWFVVFNEQKKRPHQFLVLFMALHGLSNVVRYYPVEWASLIAREDGTRAVLDGFCRLARTKVPILATELIRRVKILGSLEKIPP